MSRPSLEDIDSETWLNLADVVGAGLERFFAVGGVSSSTGILYSLVRLELVDSANPANDLITREHVRYNRRHVIGGFEPIDDQHNNLNLSGQIAYNEATISITLSVHGHHIPSRLKWTIETDDGTTTSTDYEFEFSWANGWATEIILTGPADGSQQLIAMSILPLL